MQNHHLYVHIPFCGRRCSYCDFAIAVRREVPADAYLTALEREIAVRFRTNALADLNTIYLGGGTPSRLGSGAILKLLDMLLSHWSLVPGAEVTLEANPEDVDQGAAEAWQAAGVNRVSLGVQSFDDQVLRWMHRSHDAARIREAVDALRKAGFENWSLDLIFAIPESLGRDWRYDLECALQLDPPHISCYGLTVEPHTPLFRWRERALVSDVNEATFEREFLEAHELLVGSGFAHYEVSNYTRPGFSSRHNLAYWRRLPYTGLGPSAHGFEGCVRRWNEREYATWESRLAAGEDPVAGQERLSPTESALEETYLGLRTSEGVLAGPKDRPIVDAWEAEGWVTTENLRVRPTPLGWLRLDALASALTDFRSD